MATECQIVAPVGSREFRCSGCPGREIYRRLERGDVSRFPFRDWGPSPYPMATSTRSSDGSRAIRAQRLTLPCSGGVGPDPHE